MNPLLFVKQVVISKFDSQINRFIENLMYLLIPVLKNLLFSLFEGFDFFGLKLLPGDLYTFYHWIRGSY